MSNHDTPYLNVHLLQSPSFKDTSELQKYLEPGIYLSYGTKILGDESFQVLVSGNPTREFIKVSPNLKTLILP
jgi:hypothetical protein